MNKLLYIAIFICLIITSCSDDVIDYDLELDQQLQEAMRHYSPENSHEFYILPSSDNLNSVPQDDKNKLIAGKVELGKFIFYETGFAGAALKESGEKSYSCASCHLPEEGFRPGRIQGIADGGIGFGLSGEERTINEDYQESELDIQGIRPLSLVNVAFVKNTFWNGQFGGGNVNEGTEHLWNDDHALERNHWGFEGIETQNFEGVEAHRISINLELIEKYGYKELFDQCFPEYDESERYSSLTASLAISSYIRTIISDRAPFQDWLKGNTNAMSFAEKEGALLFFGKAKCSSCHYEKNLGSSEFHVLGVKDMDQHPDAMNKNPDDPRNLGRGGFTKNPADNYKFKVPGLYNVSDSPFYFHGSSKESLEEVIRYKAKALRENSRVSQLKMSDKLHKLELTDSEIEKLVLFLEKSLRDPDLIRYETDYIKSGLCFPNNDSQSRLDLGCD